MLNELSVQDIGRRLLITGIYGDKFYGSVESTPDNRAVFIWDVTNLPLGIQDDDVLEFID